MCPQSEGRSSTDIRSGGGGGHVQGGGSPVDGYSHNTLTGISQANGYDGQDNTVLRPRFAGPAAGEGNDSARSSPAEGRSRREKEHTRTTSNTDRPRTNGHMGGKSSSGTLRTCKKCTEPLTGQFVRALGATYHLDCFRCKDCGQIVASKFFPVDDENGDGQYPLCETDYFRRLDLLCFECGGALRGSYITALERKYHIEHFTCSVCPTVFGAEDSYYEHEGKVYCHYHYSTQFAQRCNGCQTAILKQFVEIFRNGQNQHWHPECYMIHKFWNVRLSPSGAYPAEPEKFGTDATDEERTLVREEEERMEEKVYNIWSVLSTFEESSAACISDMLLHVSNGAYMDGVLVAKKFIWHVDILFGAIDRLHRLTQMEGMKELSYGREAKLLCKKIVAFFSLLSKTQETGVRKLGVTQELLTLVAGLAHYLKLLIRIGLQGALKLERERKNTQGLQDFLEELRDLESVKDAERSLTSTVGVSGLADQRSDLCYTCKNPIDDECIRLEARRWHWGCISCANCGRDLRQDFDEIRWSEQDRMTLCRNCVEENDLYLHVKEGFEPVTRLQQYVFLLRVALARLLSVLRAGGTLPHTSDDPNLTTYDSNEGHRVSPTGQLEAPMLTSSTRSKSYGGTSAEEQQGSSYEQTLGDIKRLRSTRMDKQLSTTIKKARTSRIIDGPEGRSIRPGSAGANDPDQRHNGFQIVEDRDANGESITKLTFGNQDALTLDDIPRIVAAEQAKEQRPNAYKHARNPLIRSSGGREPKLLSGHQRAMSGGQELERAAGGEPSPQRQKKYFSELSALEYFIVRHLAVMSMEPLMEGHFNLEELLGLIEPRGLIESRKPTFWNKFGKAFKNDKARTVKKKGVFGVPLDVLVERSGVESTYGVGPGALRIPGLIDDAISAMRQMDMSVEGVFRKNGNIKRLRELADQIDARDGEGVDLTKENPVQVAALLKKFLRALPDPLLTFKLHRLFITSQKFSDEDKRRRVLHLTCCLLPKSHRDSLEVLFSFLNWVASFSHIDEESGSKMDAHNLATVITPNILTANSKNAGMDDSAFLSIEAVHSLIEYNEAMCEVPEDLQSLLNDSSLFNKEEDITTKEILKRYGDIRNHAGPQRTVDKVDSPPPRSKGGNNSRAGAPRVTRIDTDVHQASAWQKESSVRHVQEGANGPSFPPGSNHTPPQNQYEFSNASSPYEARAGSFDGVGGAPPHAGPHGASPNRQSYRHSGWARQPGQPGQPGPMGVTGA